MAGLRNRGYRWRSHPKAKTLKAEIDEDLIGTYQRAVLLPFEPSANETPPFGGVGPEMLSPGEYSHCLTIRFIDLYVKRS